MVEWVINFEILLFLSFDCCILVHMKITIYFKETEKPQVQTYDIEIGEFKRLSIDYENFLRDGLPKEGSYLCTTHKGDENIKSKFRVPIHFDKVAAIG
jgi:hypothetical protein